MIWKLSCTVLNGKSGETALRGPRPALTQQILSASAPHGRNPPSGVRGTGDDRVDPGQTRMDDQYLAERLNLGFRQHVAAIGRRVNTLCKHEAGLRQQLAIFQTYHNFVLPHASLRLPLPECDAICETGSRMRWQPQTPAMAAGLTDRVWSLREVLMYRVPPWPQSQMA
jgi:hypothetical protein